MMIAGVYNITYKKDSALVPLCDIGDSASVQEDVTLVNGVHVREVTLTFTTSVHPADYWFSREWHYIDRNGVSAQIGPGDEDDYPVVVWSKITSKSDVPMYRVTVSMKERVL